MEDETLLIQGNLRHYGILPPTLRGGVRLAVWLYVSPHPTSYMNLFVPGASEETLIIKAVVCEKLFNHTN